MGFHHSKTTTYREAGFNSSIFVKIHYIFKDFIYSLLQFLNRLITQKHNIPVGESINSLRVREISVVVIYVEYIVYYRFSCQRIVYCSLNPSSNLNVYRVNGFINALLAVHFFFVYQRINTHQRVVLLNDIISSFTLWSYKTLSSSNNHNYKS